MRLSASLPRSSASTSRRPISSPLTFASHAYPDFHLLMPLFLCTRWRGEPAPHEGQELAWVKPTELAAYAMPPADEPLKAVLPALLR